MQQSVSTRTVILAAVIIPLCLNGCSDVRTNLPPNIPAQTAFPQVIAQTGAAVSAVDGVTSAAATVIDPASGAAATVPAGTRVLTNDPRYDTDGDGLANSFAAAVAPLSAAQMAASTGSLDGGQTFRELTFVGGAAFEPADAFFSPAVQLSIPLAPTATATAGAALDVWRFADTHSPSQVGGGYWLAVGRSQVVMEGGKRIVRFNALQFGAYAISLLSAANGPPSIAALSANPWTVEAGAEASLSCNAIDPDGDTLSYLWSGGGEFTMETSAFTSWSADAAGTYALSCTVSDGNNHEVTGMLQVAVTGTTTNQAPVIASVTAAPYTIPAGGSTNITCTATDADGDELAYAWSGPGTFGDTAAAGTTWSHGAPGTYSLTCTVSDGRGGSNAQSTSVTVTAVNHAPQITGIAATPETVNIGESSDLSCSASDADGDALTYTWSGEGRFIDAAQAATMWSHDIAGDYTLTCTVEDNNGGIDSANVDVTVLPDTNPPHWPGDDAGLAAEAREGFVLLTFNEAADTLSAPVSFAVYYDTAATFDVATATLIPLEAYPTIPVRIDGLTLGTEYTFGVIASDDATAPNSTALVTIDATPRPYYDEIPAGGHDFAVDAKFADVAAVAGSGRALSCVWADPLSGALRQSYYTDSAWVVRNVSTAATYTIPQVVFLTELPAIAAADDNGNLDLLTQADDGTWATLNLFTRPGVQHVMMDVLCDNAAGMLYIAHITEDDGLPRNQIVHFIAVDLTGVVPVIADRINDHASDAYIGQVRIRQDSAGGIVMIYSHGEGAFSQPNWLDTELAFAAYDSGTGFTVEEVTDFTPLYFDVRATAGGWELAVTDCELIVLGADDFMYTVLRLAEGSGASWTTTDVFTEDVTLVGEVINYDAPLECALAPSAGSVYFTRGAGELDLALLETTATLSLWSATPPAAPAAEEQTLSRFTRLSTPAADFLLGAQVPNFEFHNVTNQLEFPGGNLELRELP